MDKYVDGFLMPLPKDHIDRYRETAELAGHIWKEHGALAYWECIGDDLDVKDIVPFRQAAGAGPDETVVFSWIVFPSRAERDRINAAVLADPRMEPLMKPQTPLPFDCKRMAYGGFQTLVVL